jgi:hypothetical protein
LLLINSAFYLCLLLVGLFPRRNVARGAEASKHLSSKQQNSNAVRTGHRLFGERANWCEPAFSELLYFPSAFLPCPIYVFSLLHLCLQKDFVKPYFAEANIVIVIQNTILPFALSTRACNILQSTMKYGLNVIPANFPVFKRVAQRILCKVPSDAERSQSRIVE